MTRRCLDQLCRLIRSADSRAASSAVATLVSRCPPAIAEGMGKGSEGHGNLSILVTCQGGPTPAWVSGRVAITIRRPWRNRLVRVVSTPSVCTAVKGRTIRPHPGKGLLPRARVADGTRRQRSGARFVSLRRVRIRKRAPSSRAGRDGSAARHGAPGGHGQPSLEVCPRVVRVAIAMALGVSMAQETVLQLVPMSRLPAEVTDAPSELIWRVPVPVTERTVPFCFVQPCHPIRNRRKSSGQIDVFSAVCTDRHAVVVVDCQGGAVGKQHIVLEVQQVPIAIGGSQRVRAECGTASWRCPPFVLPAMPMEPRTRALARPLLARRYQTGHGFAVRWCGEDRRAAQSIASGSGRC